jgi:SAM-dependent methyltransferase
MEKEIGLQQKAHNQLESFLIECGIECPRGKKILEIGFKNGLFLNECREVGLISTGIEINREYYEKVKAKYPDLDVLLYDGQIFPVPDEFFDFVVSYQVLEHVSSIEHIFNECIRILKSGGIMYHVCPNYFSFYEGHCKVIWLPFFNKALGRLYLKLLGRYNPGYETLNLINPKLLGRALERCRNDLTVISLGRKEFINKFNPEQIEKVNQGFLRGILRLLFRLPLIKKWILDFISWAHFYYPITIIAMKN